MEIFPEIGPRKIFLVPPKFGARSPPMDVQKYSYTFTCYLHRYNYTNFVLILNDVIKNWLVRNFFKAHLWCVINDGLGRGGDGAPVADPGLSAEAFDDYFDRKVADIRPMVRRRLCSETFLRPTGCLLLCQLPLTLSAHW